ncbi:MAG: PilT/PilU family type 4a pilus ATPase [Saezia sp.]
MERSQASQFIFDLLQLLKSRNGSDLFITADYPPAFKVDGSIVKVSEQKLTPEHTASLARAIMNDYQITEFERSKECNFAISPIDIGRFRVNAFMQRGCVGLVLRVIPNEVPTVQDLGLPLILNELIMAKRGLLIVVGGTGSGKTTSLAAMLDWRNQKTSGHIITVEDPIEFVHQHKGCIVTQREIGLDTDSWDSALVNALRQAPDVVLMGEIRNREAMELAINFSETGHLCLATLHANNTNQAIDRIIKFFPDEAHDQILSEISLNLRGLISQRLIPKQAGRGRVAAVEVMLNSPLIADLIAKGDIVEIREVMKRSKTIGMQTFDHALYDLYESELITYDDALRNADSVNDLRLQIKLNSDRAHKELPVAPIALGVKA